MFSFSLDSSAFNRLLKRILLMSSGDQNSIISFCLNEEGALKLYYHAKLDKGLSSILFYEEITLVNFSGSGVASLCVPQLFSIKIPEFVGEDRYPQCREVLFKFLDNTLNIEFSIKWIKNLVPNKTILNFPLLEKSVDLVNYNSLFNDIPLAQCSVLNKIVDGITICNFIKSDATSKDSNGVLFKVLGNTLNLVATDSTVAVKWSSDIEEKENEKALDCVLSNSILNVIKNFLVDSESLIIYKYKQSIAIEVDKRKALLPVVKMEYLIEDIEDFFTIESEEFVCSLELKPFIHSVGLVSNNNKDVYKKLLLDFCEAGLDISTEVNKATGVPIQFNRKSKVFVNSDYILAAAQKLLSFGYTAQFYYNSSTNRVTLCSSDGKLIFLIQGLSY